MYQRHLKEGARDWAVEHHVADNKISNKLENSRLCLQRLTIRLAHEWEQHINIELGRASTHREWKEKQEGRIKNLSFWKLFDPLPTLSWLPITSCKLSPGALRGFTGSLLSGWCWVNMISSSISSPPPGTFLSLWCLTSTFPGGHWGWEFIKSLQEMSAPFVNKLLFEALLNFSATSHSFCAWKISSSLTFSAIFFSPFSFALQSSPASCLWSSDPPFVITSDVSTHPNPSAAV